MYRTIVVPLDGSPLAERAVPVAGTLAKRDGASLRLILVHEPFPFMEVMREPVETQLRTKEREYVESMAADITARSGVQTSGVLLDGVVDLTICAEVRRVKADLVVMTTHGRTGFSRLWLGSVADAIMRHATTPILMLRGTPEEAGLAEPTGGFRNVLLPLDGSTLATQIVEHALQLGGVARCKYVLARVVEPVPLVDYAFPYAPPSAWVPDTEATKELLEEATKESEGIAHAMRREHAHLQLDVVVRVCPTSADGLLQIAREQGSDLIAIATHGRGLSRLVIGSVADKVLRGSSTAVLMYRPVQV